MNSHFQKRKFVKLLSGSFSLVGGSDSSRGEAMQVAARPYFTAGVALLGAGVIAISPVAPPMPDIAIPAISSAQVNLSAATDPITAYLELFGTTFDNVLAAVGTELADTAPVLRQIIANQITTATALGEGLQGAAEGLANVLDPSNPYGIPAQLQLAFEDLVAGDINGAVSNAWSALLSPVLNVGLPLLEPLTAAIRQPIQNLLNVVDTPLAILYPVLGALSVAYGTVIATGNVGQDIVDSIKAGDILGTVNTLVSGPAVIANAFLNGDETGGGVFGPSLGLVSAIRMAREAIAAAITPPAEEEAPAAANATLASASKVVTLDVTPKAAAATPVAAAVAAPAAADETVTAAEDAADAAPDAGSPVVKESIKAEPGKTLSTKRPTPVKQVREGVQGAVKNLTDGIKKATEGLGGKSTKAGKHAKSSGGSSSSGSSSASSSGAA
ncbi:hypothetical protein [Mycolicibacterium conceptionense]|uniref:hypothetical protein n=1 Tax=Mycolicibacterium conceptionense TaxID=451644 RepID=UPI00103994D6|nr:hypothetical protein [Mycolicibacterium conceptionense]